MQKFIYATLAAVAVAVEKPQFDHVPVASVVQAKLKSMTVNLPQGGTAPQFTQTDPMLYFMMDPTLTYSVPAVPDKGITLLFCLGGIFFLPEYVDHLNFRCKLSGVPVYNQNFEVLEQASDMWTYCLPFDVPSYAPSTEYFVTITGKSSAKAITNTDLFSIDCVFSLF